MCQESVQYCSEALSISEEFYINSPWLCMGSLTLIFSRSVGNVQPKRPSRLCVQQTMTIRCQRNYSIWVLLLFTIVKQIQRLNPLKRASIFSDLSSTITVTSYCFGALSQVRAIGHCVVGQECGIVWPGPVFCLLLGVSSGCAWPITGQVTSVTWPVIGWA